MRSDYYSKLGGKSAVKPESLGPTSDATAKHSERVYDTVQSWCGNDLPPEQWGWKMLNWMCLPVQMTKPPTPHELLKIIRCGCKIECTTGCTCITYGLKCTAICTGCRGGCCVKTVFSVTWMWKYNTLTGTASDNTLHSWQFVHFSYCIPFERNVLNV